MTHLIKLVKLFKTCNNDFHLLICFYSIGRPQPDNREEIQNGAPENCLAILNNFYGDGINWHDVACHHRKPFVCEESESLLKYVQYNNPALRIV